MADTYFGNTEYRYAILLATNARAGNGFSFVSNPNGLTEENQLCIPVVGEAEMFKNRFQTYVQAVREMALPYPSEVTDTLDPIDPTQPATVVSWVRRDQAQGWRAKIGETLAVGGQSWVTLARICKSFARTTSVSAVQTRWP